METLDTLLQQAGQLLETNETGKALDLLDSAPQDFQLQGRFHFAKGALHFRTQDIEKAIVSFENALELGPPIPEFFSNLGAALLYRSQEKSTPSSQEDLERAIALLEQAVDMGPKLPHTYVNLGRAWVEKKNSQKARYYFELALELFPEFEPAQKGLEGLNPS